MKPKLKAPTSKLLKLEHKRVLPNYAFKFNLRRYIKRAAEDRIAADGGAGHTIDHCSPSHPTRIESTCLDGDLRV